MQLPANLFEEIAGCSVAHCSSDNRDRRRSQRFQLSAGALLVRFRHGQSPLIVQASLRELSRNGVSIVHSERLWLDEDFLLRLPTPSGSGVWVHCRTTRWQPLSPTSHIIGAEFTAVVEPSDIVDPVQPAMLEVELVA